MNDDTKNSSMNMATNFEQEYEGIYGRYRITATDKLEVKRYRLSVLVCGLSFFAGLGHWLLWGPSFASIWLIPMMIGLGLALNWIHIYLRPLHIALQILWGLGCIGITALSFNVGAEKVLSSLANQPSWTIAIGPLFAAMTGLGFKEFFCFRRPEAIGLTLLLPISLLGHLTGLLNETSVMTLLICSSILLLILSIRKFGIEAAADIGDKSVFEYLENKKIASIL